jgi:uncharacterized RDD family membrane protein YckC
MEIGCKHHPEVREGLQICARCQNYFCEDCLVTVSGEVLCATCKGIVRASPVGVAGLRYASIAARGVAQMVDGTLLVSVFYTVLWMVGRLQDFFSISSQQHGWAALVPAFSLRYLAYALPLMALNVCYEAIMLRSRSQTLGKILMRIKVVGATGEQLTARQAWLRAAARNGLGLLSLMVYADYLTVFVGRNRATLHDRLASTRVVVN